MDAEIHIEEDGGVLTLLGKMGTSRHLLKNALDDIADKIESTARLEAPDGDTGELRDHPVDRDDTQVGSVEDIRGEAAGFRSVRGVGGQFIRGKGGTPGGLVGHIVITIPQIPRHAIWVHNGTGIYGSHHTPIVPRRAPYLKFTIDGKTFRRRSVLGQEANPYLLRAYRIVNRAFVPARVERLRAELRAIL